MTIWKKFIIAYDENDYDQCYPNDPEWSEPPHNGQGGILMAQVFPLDGGFETRLMVGYIPSMYAKRIVAVMEAMNNRAHDFRGDLGMWE